jgi:hypothetical protein
MCSWRVVLMCSLVAFLATASAQWSDSVEQCKKDGDAEGAKVASQVCTTKKVSDGTRWIQGQLS